MATPIKSTNRWGSTKEGGSGWMYEKGSNGHLEITTLLGCVRSEVPKKLAILLVSTRVLLAPQFTFYFCFRGCSCQSKSPTDSPPGHPVTRAQSSCWHSSKTESSLERRNNLPRSSKDCDCRAPVYFLLRVASDLHRSWQLVEKQDSLRHQELRRRLQRRCRPYNFERTRYCCFQILPLPHSWTFRVSFGEFVSDCVNSCKL